uniref:Uncharacterized protein n=1 Tax=Pararge aegeria TaxID=116150 RepID=S4NXW4_9NEOP
MYLYTNITYLNIIHLHTMYIRSNVLITIFTPFLLYTYLACIKVKIPIPDFRKVYRHILYSMVITYRCMYPVLIYFLSV